MRKQSPSAPGTYQSRRSARLPPHNTLPKCLCFVIGTVRASGFFISKGRAAGD